MIRAAVLALAVGSAAQAGIIGDALVITATNELGTARYVLQNSFSITENVVLRNEAGEVIAELAPYNNQAGPAGLPLSPLPIVSVNFTAVAGAAATVFTFASGLLDFSATPFVNPTGITSAGISVTDRDGNGASLGGLQIGGTAYRADAPGLVPGGSLFAALIPSFNVGSFGTEVRRGSNVGVIPGIVGSMSSEFSFLLSANDSVGGTSVFVIPSPGALALVGIGGLVAGRRRR